MDTQVEIAKLETEQNRLKSIMRQSDDRQNHCGKTGKSFEKDYPEEYAEYQAAYSKYNANKPRLEELRQLDAEEREKEAESRPSDMSNL